MLDLGPGILGEFAERASHDFGQYIEAGLGVWRKDDPETHRARTAKWRANNKERKRESNRKWRLAHPNYQKEYRAKALT